jgi:o-succinylbenzoate synthase
LKATYHQYILDFKQASGTSRGILTTKETWFIVLRENNKIGIGECGILRGLSIDDRPDYEQKLAWTCQNIQLGNDKLWEQLQAFPSIQFGVEMAFLSLKSTSIFNLFPSDFMLHKKSIPINGLVWMGEKQFMKSQIKQKLNDGFKCIKLKIGAINFEEELELLRFVRAHFSATEVEIRVDANGAFDPNDALEKLHQLHEYQIHSIEQPVAKQHLSTLKTLCKQSPFPIALDESLIGVFAIQEKEKLLVETNPQYITLKPSFIGGFRGTLEWISIAQRLNIGWWVTSALESNIGLNAIAQWTFLQNNSLPQGLGTGGLYTNNFDCSLEVENGQLWYNENFNWNFEQISKIYQV